MHFTTVVPAALLAAAAVAAAPLSQRAGPSGQVLSPAGGDKVISTMGYPDGKIHFIYQAVFQSKQNDCAFFSCNANTQSVKVELINNGNTYTLADRLAPPSNTAVSNIDTYLSIPANVCGNAQVVVTESQNLWGQQITFQSAAPSISITCDPLP